MQFNKLLAAAAFAVAMPIAVSGAATQSDPVHVRQQNFKSMGKAFKVINDQMRRPSSDKAVMSASSRQLRDAANRLASENWFPRGSGRKPGVDTDASASIWSNPKEFRRLQLELKAAAGGLAVAIGRGNEADIKRGLKAVGASCSSCHKQFRIDD